MNTFCPATIRLLRQAVNPRTEKLILFEISWLLTALLGEAGATTARTEELRDAITGPHRSGVNGEAIEDGADIEIIDDGADAADRLIAVGKKFVLKESGRAECLCVLRAQAYKRDPIAARAHEVMTTHRDSIEETLGERRFGLYLRKWRRMAIAATVAEPPPVRFSSAIQRALDKVIAAEPAEAIELYRAVIQLYSKTPSAESRKEIEAVIDQLPFRTCVVATPLQREGSEGNKSTQSYLGLEIPLPVTPPPTSAEEIVAILRSEFPWLVAAVDAIELDLLVCKRFLDGVPFIMPKLLFGLAGCGKTSLCSRLASLLDQPSALVNAAGATSTRLLVGTTRGWSGSRPSLPAELMGAARRAQATIIVDEVEKESRGGELGRFSDGLLNFLEPSSSSKYFDECLFASCDYSGVNWLATCNDLRPVSAPLLSRFQVITCPQPAAHHMPAIVQSTLRSLRHQYRLPEGHELLDGQARMEIETLAPCADSARACAHLVRQKAAESLRREFQSSSADPLAAVKPTERMH